MGIINRRKFLSLAAASASLALPLSLTAANRTRLKVVYDFDNHVCRVDGTRADKMKFYESWQTAIWPDWRTHKNGTVVRDQYYSMFYGDGANSTITFYMGADELRVPNSPAKTWINAVEYAARNCGVPVDEERLAPMPKFQWGPLNRIGDVPERT